MKVALIGSYAPMQSSGLYLCSLENDLLEIIADYSGFLNPSFICEDTERKLFFAVEENENETKTEGGALVVFTLSKDGIRILTRFELGTAAPCYISADVEKRLIFVANYSSSNVSILSYSEDGSEVQSLGLVKHRGSGADESRQEAPHPHCVIPLSENQFLVSDLGIDEIRCYTYLYEGGNFEINNYHSLHTNFGAGPRHSRVHFESGYLYTVCELNNTVLVFSAECSCIEQAHVLQAAPTLPADFKDESLAGELCFSPDGKYCYVSNRGHNSIVVFSVELDGSLQDPRWYTCGGDFPRHIAVSPCGRWLFAANQLSNNVAVFERNADGSLIDNGLNLQAESPTYVHFTEL